MPNDNKKQIRQEDSVRRDQENYQGEKGGQTQPTETEEIVTEDVGAVSGEDIVNDEE